MSAQSKTASDGGTLNLTLPTNGTVTVNFASTSSQGGASITTYAWKSNGTQICANSSSCTFAFGTEQTNTITLTVTDSNGLSSTATGSVTLAAPSGPTAHFTMSGQDKTANDGETLNLSAPNGNAIVAFNSTSTPGSAPITTYVWRLNGAQVCGNLPGCGLNLTTAGNTMTLTVTDSNGLTSTTTGSVNLTSASQSPPTAHFTMAAQSKTANDTETLNLTIAVNETVTVNFTSTSFQGTAPITTYAWRSNGTPICANSPSCGITFAGNLVNNTVTLTVTDSNGLTSTASGVVHLLIFF